METYLAVNTPLRPPTPTEIDGHLDFLAELEATGRLLLSGPFAAGGGAYLFLADSRSAAEETVERDPFKLAGQSAYAVHAWSIGDIVVSAAS